MNRTAAASDPVTAPWWDATREKRLLLQHCTDCDHFQHYPRTLCLSCRGSNLEFVEVSGAGVVHSFTVVHRSADPAHDAPYVVALIKLEQGPVCLSNVVEIEVERVACGMPVELTWVPLDDGRHLPVFKPGGQSNGL